MHYHVEHNLPVPKELVFEMVPELFMHEINKLDYEDRKRFEKPKLTFTRADGDLLDVDVQYNIRNNRKSPLLELHDKSMRMEMYLYEQSSDLYEFYFDKMKNEVLYGGHVGLEEYMTLLEVMD